MSSEAQGSERRRRNLAALRGEDLVLKERVGLWLARVALRATGNRKLANASRVLPLIPQRRLSISLDPHDFLGRAGPRSGDWYLWREAMASGDGGAVE